MSVSDVTYDPHWDAFLAATPGGDHAQTGLWAGMKAWQGWRVARVIVRRDERIVGGAQLLLRPIPLVGAVGYVPRGPICAPDEPTAARVVVRALRQLTARRGVRCLIVQPPLHGERVARELVAHGFRGSVLEPQPAHAVLIDLHRDLDEILASMHSKTRYNLRLGQRKGVVVRDGAEGDLDTFHRLLVATARRQGFEAEPREYYSELWRRLGPAGHVKLFLVDYAGETVSAELAVAFGDTVTYKRGAWSGRHGTCRPNEVMHWEVIKSAKAAGYRFYDLEGIDPKLAARLASGTLQVDAVPRSLTSFKLGFGGSVTLTPGSYAYVPNPVLRGAYTAVSAKLEDRGLMEKAEPLLRSIIRG
ncbi:MAG: aminoacyltransferase [Chloroflexota bacterium]|nr:aminoacyltransferase [Chloroflexota bacterium]